MSNRKTIMLDSPRVESSLAKEQFSPLSAESGDLLPPRRIRKIGKIVRRLSDTDLLAKKEKTASRMRRPKTFVFDSPWFKTSHATSPRKSDPEKRKEAIVMAQTQIEGPEQHIYSPVDTSKCKCNFCGMSYDTQRELTRHQKDFTECAVRQGIQKAEDSAERLVWLNLLCVKAEHKFRSIVSVDEVWIGYDCEKANQPEPIIVTVYNKTEKDAELPDNFFSFKVHKRHAGIVSEEGKFLVKLERDRNIYISKKELQTVRKCLAENSEELMQKYSNIQMIGASKIKCKGWNSIKHEDIGSQTSWDSLRQMGIEQQLCIVLYVYIKGIIPFGEQSFPHKIGEFPVDVREGLFDECTATRFENLIMGCEFETAYGEKGSLGGFVKISEDKVGCITCCHIFKSNETEDYIRRKKIPMDQFNQEVYQPDRSENNPFGKVIKYVDSKKNDKGISVDAALIEITDKKRHPKDGVIIFHADDVSSYLRFESGEIIRSFEEIPKNCEVIKYGAGSGFTVGTYQPEIAVRTRCKGNRRLKRKLFQQIEIAGKGFATYGDSGSLAFVRKTKGDNTKLYALGIVVGITSNKTVAVTPIWAVLGKLGLPKRLYDFTPNESERIKHLENDMTEVKSDITEVKSNMNVVKSDIKALKDDSSHMRSSMDNMDKKFDKILDHFEKQNA